MTFKSKLHRAAVLVQSLNERQAQKLLERLDPTELKRLSDELQGLENADKNQQRRAARKFVEFAERVKSQDLQNRQTSDSELPFLFLTNLDGEFRHALLVEEHPGIIAAVLSLLPIQIASETLNAFEPVLRVGILRRLCRNEKISSEELVRCSNSMKLRLKKMLVSACRRSEGVDTASRLLSCTDASTRETLFASLTGNEIGLANDLKSRLIGFKTLLVLSDKDIKTLLARTDTSFWAPALVHSPKQIRCRIFDNLAERPADILKHEMQDAAHVDFLVGSSAQAGIVGTMLELADAGLIRLDAEQKKAA